MKKFGIGQPVRRTEDARFLTGAATYVADMTVDGEAHGVVLRSPHAHARIASMDTAAAAQGEGVLGIFTGADFARAGLGPIPCIASVKTADGAPIAVPPRPALAADRVRYAGEPVAFIIAETLDQAETAGDLVMVDYEPLPPACDLASALDPATPVIWPDNGSNEAFHFVAGNREAAEKALGAADHVVTLDLVNNRVAPVTMETRGVIAAHDSASGRFTVHGSLQGVHGQRTLLANAIFGIDPDLIRIIAPEVGGSFGSKNFVYPELVLAMWAARELGRPVKWIATRMESFISDIHARDHVTHAELGVSADGRMLALKMETIANMGAYLSPFGPHIPTNAQMTVVGGIYDIPAAVLDVRGAFTNTVPLDAYRGAGRPEANFVIERLVDLAAAAVDIDPVEMRRQNAITTFPHQTALGNTIDCGGFGPLIDKALKAGDRHGYAARQAASAARGKLRGFGLTSYLESTLGAPDEMASIRIENGRIEIATGTQSTGQGHETAFAQMVHDMTGIALEQIVYVQADTGRIASGYGHGGSRSLTIAGGALFGAVGTFKEKCREAAAHLLEAAPADIEIADGACVIAGTDRRIAIVDLAGALAASPLPGGDGDASLATLDTYTRGGVSFPNGCDVAEVEIDPDTGAVTLERFTVVDDFGRILNPLLVEGQVHGGLAQGIGQALMEQAAYDPASGQLVAGSLMDYTIPRADDLPALTVELDQHHPTALNPLGVKGCGEAGCTGSPAALVGAVCDALRDFGITHIDMPLTAQKVWRAIQGARAQRRAGDRDAILATSHIGAKPAR